MLHSLSLVIPFYNDADAFSETIGSTSGELEPHDELIVVDSSNDRSLVQSVLALHKSLRCSVNYFWTPPKGVYEAFNIGLNHVSKNWVQILNSGDLYVPIARRMISETIYEYPEYMVHVFGQVAIGKPGLNYSYFPEDQGIWPTQSVIIRKSVHDAVGNFSVDYRIVSDQLYYADLRTRFSWKLHKSALTTYDLDGLSAAVSLRNSKELYVMWRALGQGAVKSVFRAYVKPRLRVLLTKVAGPQSVILIKRHFGWAYSNYHRSSNS
jgi:glycosyltransferase involved in cell wall biosynthesis